MYQNPIIINLRNLSRKLKINNFITSLLPKKDYEYLFEKAFLDNIKPEDTVYDVGANRGFYTKKILGKIKNGRVFCFEPVPESQKFILENLGHNENLFLYRIALGSKKGKYKMNIGKDNLNATSSLNLNIYGENKDIIEVNVDTLDNIAIQTKFPNVIKIDVEGFELEVLKGASQTLKSRNTRVIAMEVHFALLERANYKNGPSEIVKILKENNYKVDWVDRSHLIAIKHPI